MLKLKKIKMGYLLGVLGFVSYLALNVWAVELISGSKGIVDDYYQKDFVNINVVSEQLILDIEKTYGQKLPLVELNIRLSENLEAGIRYKDNRKTLELFLPPRVMVFNNNQKRAYLAHEFGHYVLGHCPLKGQPRMFCEVEEGDLKLEIDADSFALRFSVGDSLREVIEILVWDTEERETRLNATFKKTKN